MKAVMTLIICLFVLTGFVKAENDKTIKVSELPKKALDFIKQYFPKAEVSYSKMEKEMLEKTYEVVFANRTKIEFDKNGAWKEVNCNNTAIPKGIVPREISNHLAQYYPNTQITKIERSSKGYEIKLSNDLELKYSPTFKLKEVDN